MIPEDLTAGIIQIFRKDGIIVGTGFLVSSNLIATCAHVTQAVEMDPGNKVKVRFYLNGNKCDAIVIPEFWSNFYKRSLSIFYKRSLSIPQEDLSILRLEDGLSSDVKAFSFCSSAGVIDHKVCNSGFSVVREVEYIIEHGEVSGKVTERGSSLLQTDSNEIIIGFCGELLWDEWDEFRRKIIGIVVSVAKKESFGKLQNVAFAIPGEILQPICPRLKIKDITLVGLFSVEATLKFHDAADITFTKSCEGQDSEQQVSWENKHDKN